MTKTELETKSRDELKAIATNLGLSREDVGGDTRKKSNWIAAISRAQLAEETISADQPSLDASEDNQLPHLSFSTPVEITPEPETTTFCLTDLTYQQAKALEQAILYGYQKQITPYSAFWDLQLDEIMTEQGLLLANPFDDFIPTAEERDFLIEKIQPWLKTTQPDDYCETCDGLGRFVARRSAGSKDWEITHTYHCENCDGTGISDLVSPFSNGESYRCWFHSNCLICEKHHPLKPGGCDIDLAITQAYYSDGMVSKAIARRMADEKGKCTEFVSCESEAKTENFGFSEEAV